MESLISSFDCATLGGATKKLGGKCSVYISEISSPTRLWIQDTSSQHWQKLNEMVSFYNKKSLDDYSLQPHQIMIGMKVAAFACGQWDRAEVISEVNTNSGRLKLFFFDYGTFGSLELKNCKMLIEDYAIIPKQAIRAALHGIKPVGNARLWNLSITNDFIDRIREKRHEIEIVKHHEHEDFYEFLLFDTDGVTMNEKFVQHNLAEAVSADDPSPVCLSYPSFNMLEKLVIYPTFGDRLWMLSSFGIDFNSFEEKNIPLLTNTFAFENELSKLLNDQNFAAVKNIFLKLLASH